MATETTTSYSVTRYRDGAVIGRVDLTPGQYRRYAAIAQMPEGLVRLGDMPHDLYDLHEGHQGESPDTTIWLD